MKDGQRACLVVGGVVGIVLAVWALCIPANGQGAFTAPGGMYDVKDGRAVLNPQWNDAATTRQGLTLDVWHRPDCIPCERMRPAVEYLQRRGYPVRWIDGSRNPREAAQRGIAAYPTTEVCVSGRCVKQYQGYLSQDELLGLLNQTYPKGVVPGWGKVDDGQRQQQRLTSGDCCPEGGPCPPQAQPWRPVRPGYEPPGAQRGNNPAVCRIQTPKGLGSGTLVSVNQGRGLVVTAAHLDGSTPVTCTFAGRAYQGQWVQDKNGNDLAAVLIADPGISPIEVAENGPKKGDYAVSIGFGAPSEGYMESAGIVVQVGVSEFLKSGPSRQGDSGGPVLDSRGRLIGVLWGTTTTTTRATSATVADAFLCRAGDWYLSPYRSRTDGRLDALEQRPVQPPVIVQPQQPMVPIPGPDLGPLQQQVAENAANIRELTRRADTVRDTAEKLAAKYDEALPGIKVDVAAATKESRDATDQAAQAKGSAEAAGKQLSEALDEENPNGLLGKVKDRLEGVKDAVAGKLLGSYGWPAGIALALLGFFVWDLRQKIKTGDPLLVEKVADRVHEKLAPKLEGTRVGEVEGKVYDRLEAWQSRIDARLDSLAGKAPAAAPPS